MTAPAPPTSQKAELLVSCLPPANTFFFFAVLPGQSGASLPLQLRVSTCCRTCVRVRVCMRVCVSSTPCEYVLSLARVHVCVCTCVCVCVWPFLGRSVRVGFVTELHPSVPSSSLRNLGPCTCALETTVVPESSASKPDPLGCPGWVRGGSAVECLLSTCETLGLIPNTIKKKN